MVVNSNPRATKRTSKLLMSREPEHGIMFAGFRVDRRIKSEPGMCQQGKNFARDMSGFVEPYGWVGHRRPKKCVASSSKGSSDSPTSFSGVVKCKMPQTNPSCPRTTFAKNKKLFPQNVFLGPELAVVTSPPYTKT